MQGPQAFASTVPSISFRRLHLAVALDCRAHLLGAGGHEERHGGFEPVRLRLLGDIRGAAHILVGRVGAAADQRGRDLVDKAVLRVGHLGGELGDRARPVGRMGTDDVGLELGEIELDDAVVVLRGIGLDLLVRFEQMLVLLHQRDETFLAGGAQVFRHVLVGREDRGRGAELGAHIGDRRLAGGADRARAGADIFDDRVGRAGDGQLAGDVEDDVLGRRPPAHAAGEVNRDVLRVEHLPGQSGDDLDGIGAAHSDGAGAETAGVRRVRVGADDQLAGEGVLFQHHLVDDAGAGPPEAQTVFGRRGTQKVIDLLVLGERLAQIGGALDPRLDQVVAVDRRRHRDLVAPGLHELQAARFAPARPGRRRGRDGPAGSSCRAPAPGVRGRRGAPAGSCRPTSTAYPTGAGPPRGSAPSSRRPQPPFPVSIR